MLIEPLGGCRRVTLRPPVKGAFGVNADAYIEAIRIIESGRFPLEKLHSGKFDLPDTETAIQALGDGNAVHVCVCPNGGTNAR